MNGERIHCEKTGCIDKLTAETDGGQKEEGRGEQELSTDPVHGSADPRHFSMLCKNNLNLR
jgi:hypothetical protein